MGVLFCYKNKSLSVGKAFAIRIRKLLFYLKHRLHLIGQLYLFKIDIRH